VLVSFPDPRLQTCLQQVCSVLAMSGQQIVNGISQSLTDRVKNSLQLGLFIIMVGAVLATNCKDTSNHLIVCWTNLVMHTVVMKHCSQTQGYSTPAPRLLIPSPKATHFPAPRLLIPSPRAVLSSQPQGVLIPRPQGCTHSQPQGYSFPAPGLYSFPAPGVYKHTSCLDPRLLM